MFDQVIVDDDLITVEQQDYILEQLTSPKFAWSFALGTHSTVSDRVAVGYFKSVTDNLFEYTQFSREFGPDADGMIEHADLLKPLVDRFIEKYSVDQLRVFRIKANLLTKVSLDNPDAHQTPHVDFGGEHLTLLYYACDSDGDTFIFNEQLTEQQPKIQDIRQLTVKQRISPKKGRFVAFNGWNLHAGMHPRQHDYRIVLNFNVNIGS
jgi:hypothetical protein